MSLRQLLLFARVAAFDEKFVRCLRYVAPVRVAICGGVVRNYCTGSPRMT